MKQKEKTSLAAMTSAELGKRAAEVTEKLNEFRVKRMTTQVKNTREGKTLRRALALISGMIQAKKLSELPPKGKTA